jgi:hypothetical protein
MHPVTGTCLSETLMVDPKDGISLHPSQESVLAKRRSSCPGIERYGTEDEQDTRRHRFEAKPLPLPTGEDDDDFYSEDAMDVDTSATTPKTPVADASGSLPSRKSQRLDDGEDIQPAPDSDLPTCEDLEVYRNRLEKLEGKIIDLDNDLAQTLPNMKTT